MDQTPGPSIARAVPIAANRISARKLPFPENAAHSSKIARAPPAMGVHKPRQSSSAARPGITVRNKAGAEVNSAPFNGKTAIAVTNRRHTRPIPGPPRAKLEYSRCKTQVPVTIVTRRAGESKHQSQLWIVTLSSDLLATGAALPFCGRSLRKGR